MSFHLESEIFKPEELSLDETLYHCANGYVGMRGNIDEGVSGTPESIRGTYINGFYDTHPIHHPEKLYGFPETGERMLNVTDAQELRIVVDGERMLLDPSRVSDYRRILDMRSGYTTRRYAWLAGSGATINWQARRLASFAHTEWIAMEYRLATDRPVEILIESLVDGNVENFADPEDPRVSGEGFRSLSVREVSIENDCISVVSETGGTGLGLRVDAHHRLEIDGGDTDDVSGPLPVLEAEGSETDGIGTLRWKLKLKAGQALKLEKLVRFRDTRRSNLETDIHTDLPVRGGFAELAALQSRYLDAFWSDAGIHLEGDEHILAGLRFSLYGLLQSGSRDCISGIPAKGLSGEGYEGHYFWDSEIYMLPFFLHVRPELAENLIRYRHRTLDDARRQARNLGHRTGAAFPWRTIDGRECSAYYPSGSAQYHINADIAYAVGRYLDAIGDGDLLVEAGAELLFETARIWMEIGNRSGDGHFHIHGVTGPDEYTCLVSDNYYTNRMAAENLRLACRVLADLRKNSPRELQEITERIALGESEAGEWHRAAEDMYIPYDTSLGINPQDSSFVSKPEWDFEQKETPGPLLLHYHHMTLSRYQVCKQADTVLAHMLLGGESRATMRNSLDYYEQRTTHDSSLSYAAFGIIAARLGRLDRALEYFRENVLLDLDNSHGNTRDGIHAANMGGAWAAFVYGFGGVEATGGQPCFSPVLPDGWTSMGFNFRWKNSLLNVSADRDGAEVSVDTGDDLEIHLYGESVVLKPGKSVRMRRPSPAN